VRPVLQALVLADHVYQDVTGKKIIAGTFNRVLFSPKRPMKEVEAPDGSKRKVTLGGMQSGSPSVYLSLTDVCQGTAVLIATEIRVDCEDRLQTVEVVVPLPALPIKEPGAYALEVVCEGEILGFHRIRADEFKVE